MRISKKNKNKKEKGKICANSSVLDCLCIFGMWTLLASTSRPGSGENSSEYIIT